jgi:hypothetical protein
MELESIRPILSGLLGGLLAAVFCAALARWVPRVRNGKGAATLIRENRIAILLANTLLFGGLVGALALIQTGVLMRNDWRSLGLGLGGGCVAALAVLPVAALLTGRRASETCVAYAIAQKTPMALLYGLLVLGAGAFATAATSLITEFGS